MANAKRETKATAKTVDVEVVADSDARERAQQAVKALEEGTAEVVALVGVGLQVSKTVAAAELVKRSMLGVHQCTTYAPGDGEERQSHADSNRIGDVELCFGRHVAGLPRTWYGDFFPSAEAKADHELQARGDDADEEENGKKLSTRRRRRSMKLEGVMRGTRMRHRLRNKRRCRLPSERLTIRILDAERSASSANFLYKTFRNITNKTW